MKSATSAIARTGYQVYSFYASLCWYWILGGSYNRCPYFKDNLHARCHLYSISLIPYLWDKPHYRNGTFKDDMVKNLRDVAIPGTGLPLSWIAWSKFLTTLFIIFIYPMIAFIAAINLGKANVQQVLAHFTTQLVEPQDWFSFWRMNCRLASFHALIFDEKDFALEDKWTFLMKAEQVGVAVTPTHKLPRKLICKHRNEEGGLGLMAFSNAAFGGNWIIQDALTNNSFLSKMLPDNPPLSTFRVISASVGGLYSGTKTKVQRKHVTALSCVWRAGRQNATTDHSAILFNVDPNTGVIKTGTTNVHWYQRGASKILTTPWTSTHDQSIHPDSKALITGVKVSEIKEIMNFACDAHLRLCPHVPLVGWDVALTAEHNMVMLEGNFSCNFFRGDFDQTAYFGIVDRYFSALDTRRRKGKTFSKSKVL